MGRLLERAGYRVRTAGTGDGGDGRWSGTSTSTPRSAICTSPGLSGATLCEQIWHAAPDLAGHLIVSSGDLTGEGVDELVERAGVPPVLKPFTAADLLRAVAAICPAPAGPADGRQAACEAAPAGFLAAPLRYSFPAPPRSSQPRVPHGTTAHLQRRALGADRRLLAGRPGRQHRARLGHHRDRSRR